MFSSYLCSAHNSSILCGHSGVLLQLFSSTAEELVCLLVRNVEKVLKGWALLQMWAVQHKQKHSVGFNSCHQLQITCGIEDQVNECFKIWRCWAKIWRAIRVTQV